MKYAALDKNSLEKALNEREKLEHSDMFKHFKDAYQKKDYFEYNYNVNSLLLFGEVLRKTGIYNNNLILTKNFIQTLYIIHNYKDKINECRLLKIMEINNIGQACSRHEIYLKLYENSLLEKRLVNIDGIERGYVVLSDYGKEFMEYLHPRTNDPKLCSRLDEEIKSNSKMTIKEFKEYTDNYIQDVFGKQKRYMRKKLREELEKEDLMEAQS
jgi:hypothetical protein